MYKPVFICELPMTEQSDIIFRAEIYLAGMGVPEDKIVECLTNIMFEKIVNVFNHDGSFCQ